MRTYGLHLLGVVAAAGALAVPGLASAGTAIASPAAAAFQPVAASFRSAGQGVVLGGLGCSRGSSCRARLMATSDGGARWHFVKAPEVRLFNPAGNLLRQAARVSGVEFSSRRNGWLYGPGLWATHDGGAHWQRIRLHGIMPALGGGVQSMAAAAGTAYAVVSPDPYHARPQELFTSPASRNAWTRVGHMTGNPFAVLAVSGKAAWFGTSSTTAGALWATANGVRWHRYPLRCPGDTTLSGIAAASRSHVAFLCVYFQGMYHSVKYVLRSVNGGRTTRVTGRAPVAGDAYGGIGGFAVPPNRSRVIGMTVVTPGLSYVYRSATGGKTWTEVPVSGTSGGVGLNSLSFPSRTDGWLVAGYPLHQLMRTANAGRSWHRVAF